MTCTAILLVLCLISIRVTTQSYEPPAAVNTFLQLIDYYMVAYASAYGYMVVIHEVISYSMEIKISNVRIGLGIKCMTPYEMLCHERARFILSPKI